MTNDAGQLPVGSWLKLPFWPWPLALAYTQAAEIRGAAVCAAIEVLEAYPRIGWAEYAGGCALRVVYDLAAGQSGDNPEEEKLKEIEAALMASIRGGAVSTEGRLTPTALSQPIEARAWIGAEVDGEATCDLVQAGWREASRDLGTLLGERKRVVWYYDLHVPASDMLAAFGPIEALGLPDTSRERWSEAEMKAAIAGCPEPNRDKAWAKHFKHRVAETGWGNTAFRSLWAAGRGTRGLLGRPTKSAR